MDVSKTLKAFGLLFWSRRATLVWTWATVVSLLVAARGFPPLFTTVLLLLSSVGRAMSAYIYNDIVDRDMDKLNPVKRNRPLASGKVSVADAFAMVFLMGLAGMTLSLLINFDTFLFSLLWLVLFLAYSIPSVRLKKRFLFKESTIGVNFIVTGLIAGAAVGSMTLSVIFSGVILCIFTVLGSAAAVDSSDIDEDRKFGIKTLAMVLSWKTKVEMIIVFILAVMTLTPLTYVQLGFNAVFPIMVVAVGLLVLRSLVPLTSRIEKIAYESGKSKSFNTAYAFFMALTVGMAIGAIPL